LRKFCAILDLTARIRSAAWLSGTTGGPVAERGRIISHQYQVVALEEGIGADLEVQALMVSP